MANADDGESGKAKKPISKGRFFLNSIIAGAVSNLAGLTVGHPFETVIIRMQLAAKDKQIGMIRTARDAIVKEGPMSLYKGVLQPILGTSPINIM